MSGCLDRIDILLATFNGARFLPEQLRSIERQTHDNWRLLVRDDGSTDETIDLIESFRRVHSDRVQVLESREGRLGAAGSFERLLEASTSKYFSFCDQDDVWFPGKTALLLDEIRRLERTAGEECPLLVHSDLCVVDREMNEVSPSLWRYQRIAPDRCRWNQLLVQNVVTGCASIGNAAVKDVVLPFPAKAIMHDWWVALLVSLCGRIGWTVERTVAYRQHGNNHVGAKGWGWRYVLWSMPRFFRRRELQEAMARYSEQAAAALERCGDRIDHRSRDGLTAFSRIHDLNRWRRLHLLFRFGVFKYGVVRNLALLARI